MKVLTGNIVFCGTEIDQKDGLPRTFRNYTVVADEDSNGYGRAWVWCNSGIAPGETKYGPSFVLKGGKSAAYQEAINKLRNALANQGLRVREFGPIQEDWQNS